MGTLCLVLIINNLRATFLLFCIVKKCCLNLSKNRAKTDAKMTPKNTKKEVPKTPKKRFRSTWKDGQRSIIKRQKKTIKKVKVSLPENVIKRISDACSGNKELNKGKMMSCVYLVAKVSIACSGSMFSPTSIPRNVFKRTVGNYYKMHVSSLQDIQVIKSVGTFVIGSESKKYCINPDLIETIKLETTMIDSKAFLGSVPEHDKKSKFYKMFYADAERLDLDAVSLHRVISEQVANIKIDEIKSAEDIPEEYVLLKCITKDGVFENRYVRTEQAIQSAKFMSMSLLKYKGVCEIYNKQMLINEKACSMIQYYSDAVLQMANHAYWAKRVECNKRLHTNFTEMPSPLFEELCRQNNLIQIDLSNSQFCFMAQMLPAKFVETEDGRLFCELSSNGLLYDYLATLLFKGDRNKAKMAAFYAFYGHPTGFSPHKKLVRGLFPNVFHWVDNMKRGKTRGDFAKMLQAKEAEMFIDELYLGIKELGYMCFTKHDSIIVEKRFEPTILDFINYAFKENEFSGVLEIKNK